MKIKRILALVLLFAVLMLSMAACKPNEAAVGDDTAAEQNKVDEKPVLTVEDIVSAIEAKGEFNTLFYDPAGFAQAEKDFAGRLTLAAMASIMPAGSTDSESWVAVCAATDEEGALILEEGRQYLVENRFGDEGRCVRFGCIVVYGNHSVMDELSFADFTYPMEYERPEPAEPSLDSVAGIVAKIEALGNFGANYYGTKLKESAAASYKLEGEVVNVVNVADLSGENQWILIYETELESDIDLLEKSYGAMMENYGDEGHFLRFGNIIVFGVAPLLSELEDEQALDNKAEDIASTPLSVDIVVADIQSRGHYRAAYYDEARVDYHMRGATGFDVTEIVELSFDGNQMFIYGFASLADAESTEELYSGAEGQYAVRFGNLVICGNAKFISELDYSKYAEYVPYVPGTNDVSPSTESVEGLVSDFESKGSYAAVYYKDSVSTSSLKNSLSLKGNIVCSAQAFDIANEDHWITVVECASEADADLAAANCINRFDKGETCRIARYGNIVVYGTSPLIEEQA